MILWEVGEAINEIPRGKGAKQEKIARRRETPLAISWGNSAMTLFLSTAPQKFANVFAVATKRPENAQKRKISWKLQAILPSFFCDTLGFFAAKTSLDL